MQKKIHIVHIIPTLNFGGAERLVVDMINHAPKEYQFSLILLKDEQPLADEITREGVEIHVVKKRSLFDITVVHKIKTVLSSIQPDVIHTHLFGADVWGRLAVKKLDIPIITTEHNQNLDESWWRRWMKKILRDVSMWYVAPSQSVATYMQNTYHISKEKTRVIKNAIVLERFQHIELKSFHAPVTLLMLGRLVEQKGHTIAFDALKKIEHLNWRLDVVGEGELDLSLKQHVQALGLTKRITFYPPTKQVADVFASHDILLMPSRWEGLGIVIMEAMAAGKLVIGADVGGIVELIDDEKNGYLVSSEDVQGLADRLRYIFDETQREEVFTIREKAREKALQEFGIATMIEAYGEVYIDAIRSV